jgi:hypothetical protein
MVFRSLFYLNTAQSLMRAYYGPGGWGFESLRALAEPISFLKGHVE